MKRKSVRLGILVALALAVSACSKPPASDSLQKGKDFLAKGELASAVIEFKNAVQADASSVDARVALGDVLERTGDMTGAEQNFRRALDLGGDADDLVPRIALILLDRSDNATLVKDFADRELPLPAADRELRGIVALAEFALKHKDKAQQQLAKAAGNGPAVRLAKAQLAIMENRPKDAVAEVEEIVKEGKAPWWALRAASRLYSAQGDREKALATMKNAYELAGWHQGVIGEYAEQLFEAGKPAEAKPLREKLRKIAPRYYRTAFIESLFQMQEGKFDEAHDSATKVLAALPDHAPSLLIAAKVELDRGELASAGSRVGRVLAKNPASLQALRLKFLLDIRRGDVKAAATTLERALRLAPNDLALVAASADLAWARGDKTGALKQMAAAAQTEPQQAEFLIKLAEMKFAVGKRDEASQAVDRAIASAKDDTAKRATVFRSVLRMKMLDRARAMAKVELDRRPGEPEPHLWMAAVVGSEGKEEAALEETGRALDIRPDYYPALLALARTASTPERGRQYDDRLKKAVDGGTKDVRIYADLARRMRVAGLDADKVGEMLARGVAADPASVAMREAAVRHWLAWGRKDKALLLASEGEAAQPDDLAVKALAAATNEMAGNVEQAAAKYAELQGRFPDRVDWGIRNAGVLVAAGKPQEAMSALRKLISQRADEPEPYRLLAMLQADQKQVSEALLTADMLADKPKLRAAGLLLRGDIHARAQDKGEALKAYDEAARAGAAEEAMLRRVMLQERTGGEAFAAGELRDWLNAHPTSIAALSLAVQRAMAGKDHATAIRHLESIVKLAPDNAAALNDLAWGYAQTRNPAALATAEKAVRLAPENPQILDTLAEAQALAGRKKEALATLRLALALAPRNPVIKVHLAEQLVAAGDKKEANLLLDGLEREGLDKDSAKRYQDVKARL